MSTPPPPTTVFTALFFLSDKTRTRQNCLDNIAALLKCPVYLVIFCNKELYADIALARQNAGFEKITTYNVMEVEELPAWEFYDRVQENREKYWPTRDLRATTESHLITISKHYIARRVARENPFKTRKFLWCDGCLGKKFNQELFIPLLKALPDTFKITQIRVYDKQYIDSVHWKEYFAKYRYIVGGGIFSFTSSEKHLEILTTLETISYKHIAAGFGHGEEMTYLSVLDEIDLSYGDYDLLLDNFIIPVRGHWHIYNRIILPSWELGYYKECLRALEHVLAIYARGYRSTTDRDYAHMEKLVVQCREKLIPQTTYVTAFYNIGLPTVDVDKYFYNFETIARLGIPLVVFIEEQYAARLELLALKYSNISIRRDFAAATDLPLFKSSRGELALPAVRNADKDTADYMLLMNSKIDFLSCVETHTPQLGWIDFGIAKIFSNPQWAFSRLLARKVTDKVKIPGGHNLNPKLNSDMISWIALGGYLEGPVFKIREFCDLARTRLNNYLAQGRIVWEVNVWAHILQEYPEKFNHYHADHNNTIFG